MIERAHFSPPIAEMISLSIVFHGLPTHQCVRHPLCLPPPFLLLTAGYYFIFDSPGQAELYTHHESLARIVARLGRSPLNLRLTAIHLVDAHHCTDGYKFVAAALVSLQAMVRLELPHINVLSKADLREAFEKSGELCASDV